MNKQYFITITLIVTGLAFNPAMGKTLEHMTSQNQTINKSLTSSISTILHNRGLDEEVAKELAENFLDDEEDEMSLAMMMQHLENQNIATKEEVITYLSQAALHKQKLDVTSYDQLIGMVTKIKQKPLDANTREQLSQIAKANGYFS